MPRPIRKCFPEVTYHIYTRCIECRDMLNHDILKNIVIDMISKALEKYRFEVSMYQIMDNHIHLVIKTKEGGETISMIVQYIKARAAERYNRLNNRIGPFWNERFKDKIIEESDNPVDYFNWLVWYLGFNPVRKKQVTDPREYKYGSITSYLIQNSPEPFPVTLHDLFLCLGRTFDQRVQKFLEYEDMYRRRMMSFVF